MHAFDEPLPRRHRAWLTGTPVVALAALGTVWVLSWTTLSSAEARVVGLAVAHGALLGTALAWTSNGARRDQWAPVEAAIVLAFSAVAAHWHPAGALAYLAVPVWLASRRAEWLGGRAWRPWAATIGGALFGLLLGGHLLVNSALTYGSRIRTGPLSELVGWWAYDLAANVLVAESFFRAALFARAYRRWAFAPALALATGAALVRYLADPLLPHSIGIAVGAVFYIALLGAGNCWLLARTGSLGPGLAASALFFGTYRLLALH
jgi:hypothetical protein